MKTQLLLPIPRRAVACGVGGFLFILFSSLSLSAAPIEKGSASLGIAASFTDIEGIDLISGFVDYNYLVMDSVGIRLGAAYTDLGYDDAGTDVEAHALLARLGADYYFTTEGGDWATYIGASFAYGEVEAEEDILGTSVSGSVDETGFEARVGFQYFFSEAVALDTRISYLELDELDLTTVSLGLALWF